MIQVLQRPRSVDAIVAMYIDARRRRERPISIAEAIRAIRTAEPELTLDDRAIGELVAQEAVDHGLTVMFDLSVSDACNAQRL